jgi:hypothetical protein
MHQQDISFLNSRISSSLPGFASVTHPVFRDVPIITAFNSHKDEINVLGSNHFAAETGQNLTYFYSEDQCIPPKQIVDSDNGKTKKGKSTLYVKHMTAELQELLWNQPPSCTSDMVAGKLGLCLGLPVMIRNNLATEICITKGQEATVYGWNAVRGSYNQLMLDTLFLQLTNPPYDVKIKDLPLNVVPINRSSSPMYCSLPDDRSMYISRSQVEVLPCFAMTDYVSQGKKTFMEFTPCCPGVLQLREPLSFRDLI